MMRAFGKLFDEAARHHGVVTLAMATACGVHLRTLRRRAREEGWVKLARGAWLAPGASDTHRARACAFLLLLGDRSVVSHESAGFLHGLLRTPPTLPVLTVPESRRPAGRPGVRVHRSRTLRTSDVDELDGLRVTDVCRTLRDMSARRRWDEVHDLVTAAEQRDLVDLDRLQLAADRLRKGPGGAVFGQVVEQRIADRSDSALERDTRDRTRAAGFAPSRGPFPVRARTGDLLYLDVAFPTAWFAIECDGVAFHSDPAAFNRDRDRWRLAQQVGWRLTWVTRHRLRHDLDGLLEEVAEAHRLVDPSRPPAVPAA